MKLRRDGEAGEGLQRRRGARAGRAGTQRHRQRPTETRTAGGSTGPGGQKRRQETQSRRQSKGTCGPFLPADAPPALCARLPFPTALSGPSRAPPAPQLRRSRLQSGIRRCWWPRPPEEQTPRAVMGKVRRKARSAPNGPEEPRGLSSPRFRAAIQLHALQTQSTQDSQQSSQAQLGLVPDGGSPRPLRTGGWGSFTAPHLLSPFWEERRKP